MKAAIAILLALGLAACTAPSQALLNTTTAQCSQGYQQACAQLPALNAQVQQENQNNQVMTGVAAGAGGLLGGVVLGGAMNRGYGYGGYYHRCYGCW
jgi:hypothetical protein